MNVEEFREYCLSMEGVTEKTSFGKFARSHDSILLVKKFLYGYVDDAEPFKFLIAAILTEIDSLFIVEELLQFIFG